MNAPAQVNTIPLIVTKRPEGRPRWVRVYTSVVSLLGLFVVALVLAYPPKDWLGPILFGALAAVAELFRVELFVSSRSSSVSVSGIVAVASIVAFGPLAGALTHLIAGATTAITTSRSSNAPQGDRAKWLRRTAFNIGMWVTASAFAGWIFICMGGQPGNISQLSNLVPLVGAATIDVVVNLALLIGVISLQTGRHPAAIWRQDFRWTIPITVLGGILGGGILALAYEMFHLPGLLLVFLPVLSTGYAFRLYVNHTREYVNQLEAANRRLDEAIAGLLETLGAMLDADDSYTYGHSAQISQYAEALAEHMGLDATQRAVVSRAALVHDIGKVGVPDHILGKPGPLTADEYAIMKQHTIIGADIIGRMKGFEALIPIVRHHHERWDGRGYPDGLAGEDIPLAARIVTLADAVEAMCSDRPYRSARSFADVLAEVRRCAGRQFDPGVVDALFAIVATKGEAFFTNSAEAVDKRILGNAMRSVETKTRRVKKSMIVARSA